MRDEIEAGCAAGRLYAELLSLALASYIASRFAVQASDVRRDNGRLSKHQVQRLVEFIQSRIGSELSLTELASVTIESASLRAAIQEYVWGIATSVCDVEAGAAGKAATRGAKKLDKQDRFVARIRKSELLHLHLPQSNRSYT